MRGRYYCGRIIQAEYSPVTDFREGRCRQFDEHNCSRGPYCNFLHLRGVPKFARRYLRRTRLKARYQYGNGEGRRRRRHKFRFNGLSGMLGANMNESSDDSSLSDESEYERRWRTFPIRGNSQERRDCIAQWNEMLDERKEKKKQKKAEKQAQNQSENNNNDNNNIESLNNNLNENNDNNNDNNTNSNNNENDSRMTDVKNNIINNSSSKYNQIESMNAIESDSTMKKLPPGPPPTGMVVL